MSSDKLPQKCLANLMQFLIRLLLTRYYQAIANLKVRQSWAGWGSPGFASRPISQSRVRRTPLSSPLLWDNNINNSCSISTIIPCSTAVKDFYPCFDRALVYVGKSVDYRPVSGRTSQLRASTSVRWNKVLRLREIVRNGGGSGQVLNLSSF